MLPLQLTPHFSLAELTQSATATRLGIDNEPDAATIHRLRVLAEGMEQVRAMTGHPIHVNSGYRCEALERVLCALDFKGWAARHEKPMGTEEEREASWQEYFDRKAHPKGMAADFTCHAYGTPKEIVRAIRAAGIQFDQLILEGSWVHISFYRDAEGKMRGEVLTATFNANGVDYQEGA